MFKKLSILCMAIFVFGLISGSAFAQSYCQDVLETGNPGGETNVTKTCDAVNPETLNPGDTFSIDIWAADLPETIISSGFEMFYDPAQLSLLNIEVYNDVELPGPWDGTTGLEIADPYGPGSYAVVVGQLSCVIPDAGGDVIVAKATFQCLANGTGDISVKGIDSFDTTVGCGSGVVYDATMGTNILTVTQEGGVTTTTTIIEPTTTTTSVEPTTTTTSVEPTTTTTSLEPTTTTTSVEPTTTTTSVEPTTTTTSVEPTTTTTSVEPTTTTTEPTTTTTEPTTTTTKPTTTTTSVEPTTTTTVVPGGPGYCQDFLESGNPGGLTTGLKTCDTVNPEAVNAGETFSIDIWASDIPEAIISSGFEMFYDPAQMSLVSVEAYDGVDIAGGPWDGTATLKIPDAYGPGSFVLAVVQLGTCPVPDAGGDIIIAKATFQCLIEGSGGISVKGITDFDTTVGCTSGVVYDADMGTNAITITQQTATTCDVDLDCDDSNACTTDTCNLGTNVCEYAPVVCPDDGDACTSDSCDTVNGCNYPAITCDDSDLCTTDTCNPATGCVNTPIDCSDGDECTDDICDIGTGECSSVPTDCGDGIACTDDTCDSATGCVNTPNDANCPDDGLYCNGIEMCDPEFDCSSTGNPCDENQQCVEENDTCRAITTTTVIFPTTTTTTVEPTTTTTTVEPTTTTTSIPGPTASIELRPDSVFQSRWFFLPRLLRIAGTDTNFVRRQTAVTFQPANAVLKFRPVVLDSDTIVMLVIIMPQWLTGEIDSVTVTAVTGSESASGELGIELLPFFLEEKQGEIE